TGAGGPVTDWMERLAETIFEDRIDRGVSLEGAMRRARRYKAWLAVLPEQHDRATCEEELLIRKWPGDLCFHTGQATVFVARQGAGKTNTLSYLIEKAVEHRPEWDIYTNVPYPWDGPLGNTVPAPRNLYAVRSMTGLLRGVANSILADRIPAIAIDEMDQASTSHEWASERSESWTKFLFVERHFRVRGPLLAYHVYEHVPLPLRRVGDLRGSYFRVVVLGGERLLARVEDTSQWWVVRESVLPYQTLGLRGFSLDLDMADLESHLDGDRKQVAKQAITYLDELEKRRREEAEIEEAEAREAHAAALADVDLAIAEQHRARLDRREEIIRAFLEEPGLTIRAAKERFNASSTYLVDLRQIAKRRQRQSGPSTFPVPQEAT
ncbi:MAG: hypothetical protein ACREEC_00395, partial [Thermoplasmata archaeon]